MTTHSTLQVPRSTAPPGTVRHRRSFFVAAAAVFLISLVAAGVWSGFGALAAWNAPDDLARTTLPGTVDVTVTDTGTQYVYVERANDAAAPTLDQLAVKVTGPDGQQVTVEPTDIVVEYDARDGELGLSVGSFAATDPGTYAVSASAAGAATALAVGDNVAEPLLGPLAGSVLLIGVGLVAAVALVALGLRRS